MLNRCLFLLPWALILTALKPWRPIAGQDDAAYANFAISLSQGEWTPPGLLLAASWPQSLLGAGFIQALPFIAPLSLLMALSFIVFIGCYWIFGKVQVPSEKSNSVYSDLWLLSFFVFPVVLQHGVNYLSEIFALILLLLYLRSSENSQSPNSKWKSLGFAGLMLLPILIILQRQTTLVVPGILLLIYALSALKSTTVRKPFLFAGIGIGLSLIAYVLIPKSALQTLFLQQTVHFWLSEGWTTAILSFGNRILQLGVASGLLLFPLVFLQNWPLRVFAWALSIQVVLAMLFYLLPGTPISIGVLFTDYFPRILGCGLLSFGIWGLAAAERILRKEKWAQKMVILSGAFAFLAFTALLNGSDLKYVFPVSLAGLYALLSRNHSLVKLEWPRLSATYFALVFAVSLFVNAYYLDTTEARWNAAHNLETSGVPAKNISAGYGRDLFVMGQGCFDRAMEKVSAMPSETQNQALTTRIARTIPRTYEDEAIFEYIVKPSKLAGVSLRLKKHVQAGQETDPVSFHSYSTWGFLQHELAIFKNPESRPAWCDQE